jgi:hypothetical protein
MTRTQSAAPVRESTPKRIRRSEDQLIADLQAKIEALKLKAAAKRVTKDPAAKHTAIAVRAIDDALAQAKDATQRQALSEARSVLVAYLQLEGIKIPQKRGRKPGWRKNAQGQGSVAVAG